MKNQKFLKIFFIILGAAMISAVGCGIGRMNKSIENITKGTPESVISKENETEKIDTSDWKVYRNEKYGFEVKWPSDWIEYAELREVGFQILSPLVEGASNHRIVIMVKQMGDFSLKEYIEGYSTVDPTLRDYQQLASKRQITINGVPAYEIIWKTKNQDTGVFEEEPPQIFIKGSGSLILLAFEGKKVEEYSQNIRTFYAMVSTVRFLK